MEDVILIEILQEQAKAERKWGIQDHHPLEWAVILGEEVGEVNRAILEAHFNGYINTGDWKPVRNELLQVACVCLSMIQSLDRNQLNHATDSPTERTLSQAADASPV